MFSGFQANRYKIILLAVLVIVLLAVDVTLGVFFGWEIALVLALALLGWGAAFSYHRVLRAQEQRNQEENSTLEAWRERLFQSERKRAEEERRLQAVLSLNRSLAKAAADAMDEHALMESALSTVTGLVGALGCSFVPVDEWQQPLPPFTYGQIPEPVLSAWSAQLANHMLRDRCGSCQILASSPGACPLHPAQVGKAMTVYCLPLIHDDETQEIDLSVDNPHTGRTSGVLHLYLPAGRDLDNEMRVFLSDLLNEIALAYEAARLRSQEQVTMRQLQMLRASESDFGVTLAELLDGILQALEVDFVAIRLRPSFDDRLANFNFQRGELTGFTGEEWEQLVDQALSTALQGQSSASTSETVPVWVAQPLTLLENAALSPINSGILGVILAGANHPLTFHPRQQAILQTIAAQAALLIENDRLLRSLEYKIVIQERARLAREIHDGLAQTLAYLKLQAAQMQSYLAQGNMDRLSQVLKENYQALTEAYLDTRQSIDNLRLTPQDGLEQWLERIIVDFENTTGLLVERAIQPLHSSLAPEIQAQLIRIMQEAFSNVRKHAHARTVRVSLREWKNEQILEITDDGLGFDALDIPEFSRHGLRGMRERAEFIGADFQIISHSRQGTTVRVVLPAPCEEEPSQ